MTDYYQQHGQDYFEETVGFDPAPFLSIFSRRLPAGARVLDVGCGSGRDLLWLKTRGFDPIGFERASGLAELAAGHSGCHVITGDFDCFDFASIFVDAVMLCGSLVHVPHHRFAAVLKRLLTALGAPGGNPTGGWVYLSMKRGQGRQTDRRGRVFYYWQPEALEDTLAGCGLTVVDRQQSPSADGAGKTWMGYVMRAAGFGLSA